MEYIKIDNLQLNNYKLKGAILDKKRYGIYGKNHEDVIKLLKVLSGINNNHNTCTHNSKNIFDDKEFFKNRVHFDFSLNLFPTVDAKTIKEDLNFRYNIAFNEKLYKRLVNELDVRNEIKVTNKYEFTPHGITLNMFSILASIEKQNVVITNPLINISKNSKTIRHKIINTLCDNNKYNCVLIDASDLYDVIHYVDYLIVLGDYEEVFIIDPLNDMFIISDDYVMLKNKIFKKDNIVISLDKYSKEEYRELKKTIKHKTVNFIEAYSYYTGEKYEKDNKK